MGMNRSLDDSADVLEKSFDKGKFFEILDEEIDLEEELSEVPKKHFVIPIIKKNLGIDRTDKIPSEIDENSLKKIYEAVESMIGGYTAEYIYDILKRPLLMKELRDVDDLESLDPFQSREYLQALLDLQEGYLDTSEWKKGIVLLQASEHLMDNIGGTKKIGLKGRLEDNWGLYYWKNGDYEKAENKFKNALKISMEIKDQDLTARAYHGLGVLYGDAKEDKMVAVRQNVNCLETLREMEESNKVLRREASVLNNIGVAYHKMAEDSKILDESEDEMGYLESAAENYKEAIDLAVKLNYMNMVGWVSFNLGEVYAFLGEIEKAEQCSQDSREIYENELDDERGLSGVEMLDAVISLEKGELEKALEHINTSLELREELKEPRRVADALVCRGDIYLELDKKDDSEADYQKSLDIYSSIGSYDGVERVKRKLENL